MSIFTEIRKRIRRRKHNRDVHRRKHEGHRARREVRAIRRLRKVFYALASPKLQYDSVSVQNIPRTARAAAYYVDGKYANEREVKAQAPLARYTSIAVFAHNNADCLDIEPGNATVADAPGWYRRQRHLKPHRKPIFYIGAATADELVRTLAASNIWRNDYILWTAHYGAGKHFCGEGSCPYAHAAGHVDATQFTTNNETLDESVCHPSFWERG